MKHFSRLIVMTAIIAIVSFQIPSTQAQNKIDKQGRRQGHWIKTDKDGSRIFEGDFQDGKEVGVFNYYYPDGTLKIRNTYTDPGRYCSHEAYDNKGRLLAKGFYNQKNRDSVWHIYNEDGRLVKIAGYKMGVKDGPHIIFASNGDTAEVAYWRDNHRHGRWWKRLGDKAFITANYVNGFLQGKLVEYGDDGKLRREANFKDGAKDGRTRFFEGGVCTVDENWQSGVLADRKILLHCPTERWQSVFGIAYIMPKGSNGTLVYLNDGTKLSCSESPETLNERVGDNLFVIIDRKSRILANSQSIIGITKDDDGRDILELLPKPSFTIFPDEECLRMVRSLKRIDKLDEQ